MTVDVGLQIQGEEDVPARITTSSSSFDVFVALAQRWRLLTFVPLGIGLVTLGVAFMIPPTFTASTQLLPPQQSGGANDKAFANIL